MQIRKFILALFILLSLNFSFQQINIYYKEKGAIVCILNNDHDKNTVDFINKIEQRRFVIRMSLSLSILMTDENKIIFNTS